MPPRTRLPPLPNPDLRPHLHPSFEARRLPWVGIVAFILLGEEEEEGTASGRSPGELSGANYACSVFCLVWRPRYSNQQWADKNAPSLDNEPGRAVCFPPSPLGKPSKGRGDTPTPPFPFASRPSDLHPSPAGERKKGGLLRQTPLPPPEPAKCPSSSSYGLKGVCVCGMGLRDDLKSLISSPSIR